MARRTRTLLHRGYLYAQSRVTRGTLGAKALTAARMIVAAIWRDGYLAGQRDAKKDQS